MMQIRGIGRTALLGVASSAALLAGGTTIANASTSPTTKTLTLVLKSGGKPLAAEGAPVAGTTFTNDNTGDTGPAIASCTDPGWAAPLTGTEWISSTDACGGVDNGSNDTTEYESSFTLPANFIKGSIKVKLAADNIGSAYLNGVELGTGAGFGAFSIYSLSTTKDPTLMGSGVNTLDIVDQDVGGFPYGVDYKATITYVVPRASASVRH